MVEGYWRSILSRRLQRRRALRALGSVTASAALLAACGGDDDRSDQGSGSDLVTKPEDTSKQAKRGGELKHFRNAGTDNMDPYGSLSPITSSLAGLSYSRLTMLKAGYLEDSDGEFVGDIAESWEWSPDRLQLTMKLRNDVKFHNIAPVNGRAMDMDDVLLSWKRFSERGLLRSELVNSVNPTVPGPVLEAS